VLKPVKIVNHRIADMAEIARRPLDKLAVGLAFLFAIIAIAGAWFSQLVGGLVPCELCLEQRIAYYWGVPLLALILVFWNRLPLTVWYVATAIAALIFVWSLYMASYHAGVEWGYWPGPTACTGTGVDMNFSDLGNIDATRIVPCDAVQFRFLGLSLAGYNALVSLVITALLAAAIWLQAKHRRA
jgi:disulfide bond formation protein DsbB